MNQAEPSQRRLWDQFLAGMVYWSVTAAMVSEATGQHFGIVLPAVLCGGFFCCGLGLVWITLWAQRKHSRLGQFTVGSLFFLTLFASLFLSFVQWFVAKSNLRHGPNAPGFITTAIICAFWLLIAFPLHLHMAHGVVLFGVWIVKRPLVRRWLRARRDRRDP